MWKVQRDVSLGEWIPYESDMWIWKNYSLELLCNPHCPEFFTDDEVSMALRQLRKRTPLTFEPYNKTGVPDE